MGHWTLQRTFHWKSITHTPTNTSCEWKDCHHSMLLFFYFLCKLYYNYIKYHSGKAIMFCKTLIGFVVSNGAAVAFWERWQYLLAECYLKNECSVDSEISYPDITVIDNAEFLWNQFHFFLWSQATFMGSDWRRSKMLFVECQTECYLFLFIVIRQHCHKTAAVDTSCPWGSLV